MGQSRHIDLEPVETSADVGRDLEWAEICGLIDIGADGSWQLSDEGNARLAYISTSVDDRS